MVKYGRDESTAPPAPATQPKKKGKKRKKKERGDDASIALATTPARGDDAEPSGARTSLAAGIVKPVGARIDWASLLRHVYLEDVLACPCGERRTVIADINDPSVVAAILVHLGLPTEAPPIARARSPSSQAA